nr:DUF6597 domain-containing transcriptional factor [uncultured Lacinutrix sp.]
MPEHSIERVVPTGHVFIIFELDGIKRHTFNNNTLKPNGTFSKVWVSGMHKNYLSISAHPNSEMLVIQFKCAGAFPFFYQPIYKLNDQVSAAQDILGIEIIELHKQILYNKTSIEKFEVVQNWLLNRINSKDIAGQDLLKIVNLLKNNPFIEHHKIIESYPKTQKHLIS